MKRDSNAERALIEQLQAGDPGAVETLASAYGSKVYQLAFRYMKNREDAEEVAQDVLMKVGFDSYADAVHKQDDPWPVMPTDTTTRH